MRPKDHQPLPHPDQPSRSQYDVILRLRAERDRLRTERAELVAVLRLSAQIPNGAKLDHFIAISERARALLAKLGEA